MRADVACELRSLLHEELNARMEQSVPENAPASDNEAARTEAALALVRSYGEPATVAARYHTPMTIIDPADTTSFLRAAIVGAVSLVLLAERMLAVCFAISQAR